jgi:hypothetical protein
LWLESKIQLFDGLRHSVLIVASCRPALRSPYPIYKGCSTIKHKNKDHEQDFRN